MAFLRSVKTLQSGLGTVGRAIWKGVLAVGGTVADALGFGRVAGVEAEPVPTWREGREVSIALGRESEFAALEPAVFAPQDWYEETAIPWKRPIAYTVAIYGRDLATGRFTREERNITVSRPLTMEEACDYAREQWSVGGVSETFDFISAKVIGALRREGEPWRW